jgi:hypothetical protein
MKTITNPPHEKQLYATLLHLSTDFFISAEARNKFELDLTAAATAFFLLPAFFSQFLLLRCAAIPNTTPNIAAQNPSLLLLYKGSFKIRQPVFLQNFFNAIYRHLAYFFLVKLHVYARVKNLNEILRAAGPSTAGGCVATGAR